jgi:hypothetical protein
MRPKKTRQDGSHDLFRSRLDQIINMDHELVRLAQKVDWQWIDTELAGRFSAKGRPATETRFMVGLLILKHMSLCPTRACASAGSTTPIFSILPVRSSSSTSSRTSVRA